MEINEWVYLDFYFGFDAAVLNVMNDHIAFLIVLSNLTDGHVLL